MDLQSPRQLFTIALATILSSNGAVMLYQPSIVTVVLGMCTAIFLSKAFMMCDSISDNGRKGPLYLEVASDELSKNSEGLEVVELSRTRPTFVFRLRNISFFLAMSSAISLLALNRLDLFPALSGDWWKREAGIFVVETIRWIILSFLVFPILL
jgi:hypothetical protein